ncbi:MAG: hypothetical protein ABH828_03530 [archaeon]
MKNAKTKFLNLQNSNSRKILQKTVILLTIIVLICIPNVLGVAIGVNKAVMGFDKVLMGGYAEDSVVISTDSEEEIGIETFVTGDIEDWISFSPSLEEVVISSQHPGVLTVIVQPPADTAVGKYSGELKILTSPIIQPQSGQLGSAIRTSFKIKIEVDITGDQILACTAGGFKIKDLEITYPLLFLASVKNDGNVRIQPNFVIDIWNQQQTQLIATRDFTYGVDILPTTTREITREFEDLNLDTGQYWADISAPLCGEKNIVTFSVVEKGDIVDTGEIIRINNPLWVKVGDIVPIEVIFKNTGTRVESAKLKGTIKLADQIIKVIDTDAVNVEPGKTVSLETFFNPKMEGQYHISIRVLYNNKLTYWKNSILNALPSDEFAKKMRQLAIKSWTQISIILIVIIILLILIMIKRKKKRRRTVRFNF